MVRDIRNLEMSFGKEDIFIADSVKSAKQKLERSIATNANLNIGHVITESDIHLLSPGDGFKWNERELVIGKKITNALPKDEIIYKENIN